MKFFRAGRNAWKNFRYTPEIEAAHTGYDLLEVGETSIKWFAFWVFIHEVSGYMMHNEERAKVLFLRHPPEKE